MSPSRQIAMIDDKCRLGENSTSDCAEDQPQPLCMQRCGWSGRTAPRARCPQKRLTTWNFEAKCISLIPHRRRKHVASSDGKQRDGSPEPEPAKHGRCRETCPLSSHLSSWRRPSVGGASKRHYTAALIRRLEGGSTSLIRPSLDEMPSRSEPTRDATTASIRRPRLPRPSSPLHTCPPALLQSKHP